MIEVLPVTLGADAPYGRRNICAQGRRRDLEDWPEPGTARWWATECEVKPDAIRRYQTQRAKLSMAHSSGVGDWDGTEQNLRPDHYHKYKNRYGRCTRCGKAKSHVVHISEMAIRYR